MTVMATSRKPRPASKAKKCPDCQGKGETSSAVRVGPRGKKLTDHQQAALCMSCWGTGETP
ncbi:hypothetical protein [Streptomyces sp. NPDC048639]|uniref:hypothetical protein n=1 Tax=Streptomyces sp. NPDC048639 TaxID=3365581 RepID=UPI0037236A43